MAHFGKSNLVKVSCFIAHQTDKAILIDDGGEERKWIPKSQCEWEEQSDGSVELELEEWLAIDKGLI